MKLRNVIAAATAAVVGATLAISASAYDAFLMYTDNNWGWGNWNLGDFAAGDVSIDADGTYTVYVDNTMASAQVEDEETGELVGAAAVGATVFCVDIADLAADKGAGKDAEGYDDCKTGADKMAFAKAAGINVTDVKVTTTSSDGTTTDIAVNQDNVIFGDIEGNGKIRIEIFNTYGDTASAPAVNTEDISFDESIAVTFTITGVAEAAAPAEDTTTDTTDTTDTTATDTTATDTKGESPDTGVEGVAAVAGLAVVAAGAMLVSKKRK